MYRLKDIGVLGRVSRRSKSTSACSSVGEGVWVKEHEEATERSPTRTIDKNPAFFGMVDELMNLLQ